MSAATASAARWWLLLRWFAAVVLVGGALIALLGSRRLGIEVVGGGAFVVGLIGALNLGGVADAAVARSRRSTGSVRALFAVLGLVGGFLVWQGVINGPLVRP